MIKLNQVISIENETKTKTLQELTEVHKANQKPDLFSGHAKVFKPRDEDPSSPTGEQLPPDNKQVQAFAVDVIRTSREKWGRLYDIEAMREWGNSSAKADVTVSGEVLLKDAPVGFLLFLEKQLPLVRKFVSELPTLDAAEAWSQHDGERGVWRTEASGGARTKKLTRPMVLYEATKEHPAQVKEVTEDVFAGTWWTTKYSSALHPQRKAELLKRVDDLVVAVKFARERANEQVVDDSHAGRDLMGWIFR